VQALGARLIAGSSCRGSPFRIAVFYHAPQVATTGSSPPQTFFTPHFFTTLFSPFPPVPAEENPQPYRILFHFFPFQDGPIFFPHSPTEFEAWHITLFRAGSPFFSVAFLFFPPRGLREINSLLSFPIELVLEDRFGAAYKLPPEVSFLFSLTEMYAP